MLHPFDGLCHIMRHVTRMHPRLSQCQMPVAPQALPEEGSPSSPMRGKILVGGMPFPSDCYRTTAPPHAADRGRRVVGASRALTSGSLAVPPPPSRYVHE